MSTFEFSRASAMEIRDVWKLAFKDSKHLYVGENEDEERTENGDVCEYKGIRDEANLEEYHGEAERQTPYKDRHVDDSPFTDVSPVPHRPCDSQVSINRQGSKA